MTSPLTLRSYTSDYNGEQRFAVYDSEDRCYVADVAADDETADDFASGEPFLIYCDDRVFSAVRNFGEWTVEEQTR